LLEALQIGGSEEPAAEAIDDKAEVLEALARGEISVEDAERQLRG